MAYQQLTDQQVKEGFDKQLTSMLAYKPQHGSEAIALGRTAGLAKQMGCDATADALWNKLLLLGPKDPKAPAVLRLPSLNELYAGFQANAASGAFDRVASAGEYYATSGLAFSNAMGSLAHMIDYLRRKDVALAGGEVFRIMEVGPAALRAMGFHEQAKVCEELGNNNSWAVEANRSSATEVRL